MAAQDSLDQQVPGGAPAGPGREAPATPWRSPSRVVRPLTAVALVLCVVGPVVSVVVDRLLDDPSLPQSWLTEAARLVDLDAEANVPTWFSVVVLLGVAGGLLAAAACVRGSGRPAWPLVVPAVLAAGLSLDELASLHEDLNLVADAVHVDAGLSFAWVVPGSVVALVVGGALLVVARRLSPELRRGLVVAGAVHLTGALGFEALASPLFRPIPADGCAVPAQVLPYVLLNVCEEGLEMAGALLALRAVLRVLRVGGGRGGVVVQLDPAHPVLR